jgi:hypothetical protein
MKMTRAEKIRACLAALIVIFVFFFLPTPDPIGTTTVDYWGRIWLRLCSFQFWVRALFSGLFVAVLLTFLVFGARYLARFAHAPRDKDQQM